MSSEKEQLFSTSSSCSVGGVKRDGSSTGHQEETQEQQGQTHKQRASQHLEQMDEIMAEENKRVYMNRICCLHASWSCSNSLRLECCRLKGELVTTFQSPRRR